MKKPGDPDYWEWVKEIRTAIEDLPVFYLRLSEIQTHDIGNIRDITELTADIKENGQQVPVYVSFDKDQWHLRDGKHRYNVLTNLEMETIKVKDITDLKAKYDF